jgi:hypothetical protein
MGFEVPWREPEQRYLLRLKQAKILAQSLHRRTLHSGSRVGLFDCRVMWCLIRGLVKVLSSSRLSRAERVGGIGQFDLSATLWR